MNELISILCPTRGRPEFMESLVQSAYETAGKPISIKYLQFIFYIDEDDSGSISKLDSLKHGFNEGTWDKVNVDAVIGPRINLSEAWNRCYAKAEGDILFHAGDDLIFKTGGWDAMVRIQFRESKDKIYFVGGQDGLHPPENNFITHGFLHRNWVETVGYFVPPYFSSDYNDTWLNEVADRIGRKIYIKDLFIEHMHPLAGKHFWDRTHLERLERHRKDKPQDLYAEKTEERKRDAAKLEQYIKDKQ